MGVDAADDDQLLAGQGTFLEGANGEVDVFVRLQRADQNEEAAIDRSFCQFDEFIDPAWVPSRDTPACFVGYRCKVGPFWDD